MRGRPGRKRSAAPPAPATPSIRISPNDPGVIQGAPPQAFTFQVAVANLPTVKWAVFQVSTSGQYSSDMLWQEVAVPGSSATLSITAQLKGERDVFVVKSLDDAVEDRTVGARFAGVPAGTGTALQRVQAFVAPLRMGVNIERGQSIWNGWISDAQLRQYAAQGITHVRYFAPSGGYTYGLMSQSDLGVFYDATQRAINAGLTVFLDLMDIVYEEVLYWAEVRPYIEACAQSLASRNFDPRKFAVGVCNEYGGGSNTGYEAKREELLDVLHGALPNHVIITAGANWNNPWTMVDGTLLVKPDKPRVHQWHWYADNAGELWRTQDIQANMSAWASANNTVVVCGEYSKAPASGGEDLVGAPAYGEWPGIVKAAAEGMGQQRPMIWTVTNGSWWRLNVSDSAALQSGVATAYQNGSEFIRTSQWYIDQNAAGGAATPPPPTGGQVSRIQVVHRGQSNAYFADQYGAPGMLRDTMASLTGLPIDMVSRKEVADATIHSGTYSYWDSPYNSDDRWLDAAGNYGSAPSGWTNRGPMAAAVSAMNAHVSSDQSIPVFLFELHHEFDLAMEDAASKAAYRDGHFEITKRLRAARLKTAGKGPVFYGHSPYQGGQLHALFDIVAAWNADAADASRDVLMAAGNMMDGQRNTQYDPNGDPAHWGDQSAPRIYPRVAFRFAKLAYDRGWCPSSVNLSDCPSLGPRIVSASRSGNSINLTVEHDKGTSLVAGANGIDWRCFTAGTDLAGNGQYDASGGAITGANTIRVDFPSQPPTGGRIWHCVWPDFRFRTIIRDNWHAIRPTKYGGVPNVGVVEFPLQRTLVGVPY